MQTLEELEEAIEANEQEKRQAIVDLLRWVPKVLIHLIRRRGSSEGG